MARMPAVFLGHGSPMNALETNRYTEVWKSVGASSRQPRAVRDAPDATWLSASSGPTA